MSRLKKKYEDEILAKLREEYGIKNAMRLPKLQKIVVNRGIGKALENKKRIQAATAELALITGQCPVETRAKKIDRKLPPQGGERHRLQGHPSWCPHVRVFG